MKRAVSIMVVVGLLVFPGVAHAQQAFTIKLKDPAVEFERG